MERFARGERGVGFFGIVIMVAILGILFFVAYKFILLRVHYLSIKDIVKNRAQYAVSYSDEAIKRDIMQRAWESGILIEKDSIYVHREPGYRITITVPFSDSVNLHVKKFLYHYVVKQRAPLPR
ncbi:MAG: hypothetical protein ACE5JA_10940 [bacterium]